MKSKSAPEYSMSFIAPISKVTSSFSTPLNSGFLCTNFLLLIVLVSLKYSVSIKLVRSTLTFSRPSKDGLFLIIVEPLGRLIDPSHY